MTMHSAMRINMMVERIKRKGDTKKNMTMADTTMKMKMSNTTKKMTMDSVKTMKTMFKRQSKKEPHQKG